MKRFKHQSSEEGFFRADGFYFRERKGHLNLRKLESVNVDKLIREVDIELLQQNLEELVFCEFEDRHLQFMSDQHIVKLFKLSQLIIEYLLYSQNNLVRQLSTLSDKYTAKKRALHVKRKQVSVLKEETRHLQDELKLKRRNLRSLHKAISTVTEDNNNVVSVQAPTTLNHLSERRMEDNACIFITMPDGNCIELHVNPLWRVKVIDEMLMNQFPHFESLFHTRHYSFRGRALPFEGTLEICGVKHNDSISLICKEPIKEEACKDSGMAAPNDRLLEVSSLVNQQVDLFRSFMVDIRDAMSHKSSNVSDTNNADSERSIAALEAIHARLVGIERDLQEVPNRCPVIQEKEQRIIFGDLENDQDNIKVDGVLKEIKASLGESLDRVQLLDRKVDGFRSLQTAIAEQQIQIEDLKKKLFQQSESQSIGHSSSVETFPSHPNSTNANYSVPSNKSKHIQRVLPRTVDPQTNKWNLLRHEPIEPVMQPCETSIEVVYVAPPSKNFETLEAAHLAIPPQNSSLPLKDSEVVSSVTTVVPPLEDVPVIISEKGDDRVVVTFPAKYNPTLSLYGLEVQFSVLLERNMKDDELIIAIRKELSSKANVPYSHTALRLDGYHIKLAIDLRNGVGSLSVNDASNLASVGRLQVYISKPNVTNKQVDVLRSFKETDRYGSITRTPTTPLENLRLSLNSMLESVEKVGLSDEELTQHRENLNVLLSEHDQYQLRKSRLSVVKTLGYATSDSDSDFLSSNLVEQPKRYLDSEHVDRFSRRRSYDSAWRDYSENTAEPSNFDHTIDSEGNNIPIQKPSEKSILRYADSYEKDVHMSDDSPFDSSRLESPDHSLALSDSNNFVETMND